MNYMTIESLLEDLNTYIEEGVEPDTEIVFKISNSDYVITDLSTYTDRQSSFHSVQLVFKFDLEKRTKV